MELEHITPYGAGAKGAQVEAMFDHIAPAYDFMNRAMTMGVDRLWRRRTVREARAVKPSVILDVATGTGDLAVALARGCEGASVVGVDLSEGMLERGREKVKKAGLEGRVELRQADCLALPFGEGAFDVVTVAFGVRNFEHLERGYEEMARVLRPGGRLCVLELSTPRSGLVRPFYNLYTQGIIPWLGRMVSRDKRAYSYLLDSIAAVPQGEEMTGLISAAGFSEATFHPLTLGVATLYVATR